MCRSAQLVCASGVRLKRGCTPARGGEEPTLVRHRKNSDLDIFHCVMFWNRRATCAVLTAAIFLSAVGIDVPSFAAPAAADKKEKPDPSLKNLPITELSAEEAIQHALNRLAYGPRPGDVERIKQMGLAKWIDQQLNPNSVDDKALEARLENYPTLRMSTTKLSAEYPQPKQAAKKEGLSKEEFKEQQMQQRRADMAAERAAQQNADSAGDGESMKDIPRSEEHTSELQSPCNIVCRLLLENK